MSDEDDKDLEYLPNYRPNHLYVQPATLAAYVTLLAEDEELLLEVDLAARTRLAITVIHSDIACNFNHLKITKIVYRGKQWHRDGEVKVNRVQRSHLREFLNLLLSLDFQGATKTRIGVEQLDLNALSSILRTDRGHDLLKNLANSPELSADIFALAYKKQALRTFEAMLASADARAAYVAEHDIRKTGEEPVWQHFFEANPWIFGHGLNYVFLDKVGLKLEAVTTGAGHEDDGNRVDALMRTRAAISQYVLIEIKTPLAPLLKATPYRSGCWAVASELTEAVSQIQKTAFDFTANRFRKVQLEDDTGRKTGDEVFRIQPKSYLVTGSLETLKDYDDKFTCFQLFRSSLTSPEIVTFDELYERAKCIVETISSTDRP